MQFKKKKKDKKGIDYANKKIKQYAVYVRYYYMVAQNKYAVYVRYYYMVAQKFGGGGNPLPYYGLAG